MTGLHEEHESLNAWARMSSAIETSRASPRGVHVTESFKPFQPQMHALETTLDLSLFLGGC